ncbi:hypothetical protein K402DRAFT_393830 [Aulographum hederae CBS 113979]|uniref:Pentacotripeptide-repeat region of PRORP domain-containing protein n=1 Tax=Aulographum hederae CBS 113979 TaxID=1176131 RepID=A0A6G1H020_9PEZI|nr:hypothetical protein K402DRAFT_393830 [Aulographum hederae CBS 113979]
MSGLYICNSCRRQLKARAQRQLTSKPQKSTFTSLIDRRRPLKFPRTIEHEQDNAPKGSNRLPGKRKQLDNKYEGSSAEEALSFLRDAPSGSGRYTKAFEHPPKDVNEDGTPKKESAQRVIQAPGGKKERQLNPAVEGKNPGLIASSDLYGLSRNNENESHSLSHTATAPLSSVRYPSFAWSLPSSSADEIALHRQRLTKALRENRTVPQGSSRSNDLAGTPFPGDELDQGLSSIHANPVPKISSPVPDLMNSAHTGEARYVPPNQLQTDAAMLPVDSLYHKSNNDPQPEPATATIDPEREEIRTDVDDQLQTIGSEMSRRSEDSIEQIGGVPAVAPKIVASSASSKPVSGLKVDSPTQSPRSQPGEEQGSKLERYYRNRLHALKLGKDGMAVEAIWKEARKAFLGSNVKKSKSKMPSTLYDSFIYVYMKLGLPAKAIFVWNELIKQGIKPSAAAWTSMLDGCGKNGDWQSMERIWESMQASGERPDIYAWSARIKGLFSNDRSNQGLAALDEMGKRWLEEARRLRAGSNQTTRNPRPDASILNAAISAVVHRRSPTPYLGLPYGPDKAHLIDSIFSEARAYSITPDVVTFNTLLAHFLRNGDVAEGRRLLSEMSAANIEPDSFTFGIVFKSAFMGQEMYKKSPSEQQHFALALLQELKDRSVPFNNRIFQNIIEEFVKFHKNLPAAQAILNFMGEVGVKPTCWIYASFVHHYFHGIPTGIPDMPAIDALLEHMFQSGVAMDTVLFDMLVRGFAKYGYVERVLTTMRKWEGYDERKGSGGRGKRDLEGGSGLKRHGGNGRQSTWYARETALNMLMERQMWDRVAELVSRVEIATSQSPRRRDDVHQTHTEPAENPPTNPRPAKGRQTEQRCEKSFWTTVKKVREEDLLSGQRAGRAVDEEQLRQMFPFATEAARPSSLDAEPLGQRSGVWVSEMDDEGMGQEDELEPFERDGEDVWGPVDTAEGDGGRIDDAWMKDAWMNEGVGFLHGSSNGAGKYEKGQAEDPWSGKGFGTLAVGISEDS